MNIMAICAVLILLIYMIRGFHLGFVKTVFSTFGFIIAITLATNVTPSVSAALNSSPLYGIINEQVHNGLFGTEESEPAGHDETYISDGDQSGLTGSEEAIIESLPLPSFVKNSLILNNNQNVYDTLGISAFEDYVSAYITRLIIQALGYLIVFIIVTLFLKIVVTALDLIAKLPVLRTFNKAGGFIFGVVNGLVVLWIICIVLAMLSGTEIGQTAYAMINESAFLKIVYNSNPLLRIAGNVLIS